jgi:hypothetical protein
MEGQLRRDPWAAVRFAPNSGAKADILGLPLQATERTRLRGSALRSGVRGNDGGPS